MPAKPIRSVSFQLALLRPMNASHTRFQTANACFRRSDHARWHRQQSKRHILRSQLGFSKPKTSRPEVCEGCIHYHGIAYGYGDQRSLLICGFHPLGWLGELCPDWCGEH